MFEPSEAAKAKACELTNATGGATYHPTNIGPETPRMFAFARFIQQVSDACSEAWDLDTFGREQVKRHLAPFILPDPADPLVEALEAVTTFADGRPHAEVMAGDLKAELAKRGGRIVFDEVRS